MLLNAYRDPIPLVPLGQGLSTVEAVWVCGQEMPLLAVPSQKRLGVGGISGAEGSAVTWESSARLGSLPSRGSAAEAEVVVVVFCWPLVEGVLVARCAAVVSGGNAVDKKSSVAGAAEGGREGERRAAVRPY